jgi:hypothetical protein
LAFETDAENEYFSRAVDPGDFSLALVRDDSEVAVQDYVLNLQNGIAALSLPLPDYATTGDSLHYVARTHDCSRTEPFKNVFHLATKEAQDTSGRNSDRRKPPSKEKGEDRDRPSGIKLPNVILVEEKDWENQSPPFDKLTALRIRNAGSSEEGEEDSSSSIVYDFYINMDNVYLKSELKSAKTESELVRAQFKYGMVLLGLAMLQQDIEDHRQDDDSESERESENGNGASIEKNVEAFSRAVAPVVIPMINSLGSLSVEDEPVLGASGEAT